MTRTQQQVRDAVTALVPPAYVEMLPLAIGVAGPLYLAEQFAHDLSDQTQPATSTAPFLDLIAHGQGLERVTDEPNYVLRLRIATQPKRVTPTALEALLRGLLWPLEVEYQLVEHHRIRLKVRTTGGTPYMNEARASNNCMLGGFHGITVILRPYTSDADRLAVATALSKARAAGIRVWIIREYGLNPTIPPNPGSTYV